MVWQANWVKDKKKGRPRGAQNKATMQFRGYLAERGFNPAKEWLELYERFKQMPEAHLYFDYMRDCLKILTEYSTPKPKDLDVDVIDAQEKDRLIQVKKVIEAAEDASLLRVVMPAETPIDANQQRTGT